jgi:hypothetical protein
MPDIQMPDLGAAARELGEAAQRVGPALRGLIPSLPNLPGVPPVLGPGGPLTSQFWESVRPVAIAGAFAVGGLGLLWILWNLRMATMVARTSTGGTSMPEAGSQSGQLNELARLAPMLLTRGVVR